jgi:hypothetical protein
MSHLVGLGFQAPSMPLLAVARAQLVEPAQAHGFDGRRFGFRADQLGIARAVGLAKGVAAGDEGDGLFVVHGHAGEGLAHIAAGGHRVRVAVRAFGVHVDQAHLHGGQGVLELTVAAVAAVRLVAGGQPLGFGAPVDVVFGCPDVGAATTESKGLEAHGFHGDVAREHEEVGPGDGVAVLLFDRPEQATGLVEVAVVGPAVERGKTLAAGARATAAVGRAVGARAVPGHADEQAAVMAPVGRPPVLGVGHEGGQVLLERRKVQLLEGLGVVEVGAQGVGHRLVLVQDRQVELMGPPVAVAPRGDRGLGALAAREGAFRFVRHRCLLGHQ